MARKRKKLDQYTVNGKTYVILKLTVDDFDVTTVEGRRNLAKELNIGSLDDVDLTTQAGKRHLAQMLNIEPIDGIALETPAGMVRFMKSLFRELHWPLFQQVPYYFPCQYWDGKLHLPRMSKKRNCNDAPWAEWLGMTADMLLVYVVTLDTDVLSNWKSIFHEPTIFQSLMHYNVLIYNCESGIKDDDLYTICAPRITNWMLKSYRDLTKKNPPLMLIDYAEQIITGLARFYRNNPDRESFHIDQIQPEE